MSMVDEAYFQAWRKAGGDRKAPPNFLAVPWFLELAPVSDQTRATRDRMSPTGLIGFSFRIGVNGLTD